jgi:hypothetical protein
VQAADPLTGGRSNSAAGFFVPAPETKKPPGLVVLLPGAGGLYGLKAALKGFISCAASNVF